jgi:hypothetical protein
MRNDYKLNFSIEFTYLSRMAADHGGAIASIASKCHILIYSFILILFYKAQKAL